MFIQTASALSDFCARLSGRPRLFLDTEFVTERSYYPRLGIVQVGDGETFAVVDCVALADLAPLWDTLCDPRSLKVLHAPRGDMEIIHDLAARVPAPLFDTQIAAAFLGYGEQISYLRLVEKTTGKHLNKRETFTDWTRRPLSEAQVRYALDDVAYLPRVYHHLVAELEKRGRLAWVQEECAWLADPATYQRPGPADVFRRVKGSGNLHGRTLAVLRALAAWREEAARERDLPRGRVVSDEILVELAKAEPRDLAALQTVRGINHREVARSGRAIAAAVRAAIELPEEAWPASSSRRLGLPPRFGAEATDLLAAVARARAGQLELSPSVVAAGAELQELAEEVLAGRMPEHLPILRGWRRRLLGEDLLKVLHGQLLVSFDAASGRLRLTSR